MEARVDAERQSRHLFQEDSVDTSRLPYTRQSGVLRQDEQVAPQARDIGYTAGRRFLDSCQDADDQRADRAPDHSGNQQSEIQRPPRRGEIQRNDAGERVDVMAFSLLLLLLSVETIHELSLPTN